MYTVAEAEGDMRTIVPHAHGLIVRCRSRCRSSRRCVVEFRNHFSSLATAHNSRPALHISIDILRRNARRVDPGPDVPTSKGTAHQWIHHPTARVGARSRIAAGSVVLMDVPPCKTVAGVPARIVGDAGCSAPSDMMNQILGLESLF